MMNTKEVLSDITTKVAELEAQIVQAKDEEKSVGRLKRQARALKVISAIISTYVTDDKLSFGAELEEELQRMISSTKGRTEIIVNEGDNLVQLAMVKYAGVNNIMEKLTKQAEKKGLIVNANGIYVKK